MYVQVGTNISERSKQSLKSVRISIPTVRLRIPYLWLDPLVDADAAFQSYHTMKQSSGEITNKYRIRTEDKVRILLRLGLDVPSQQQQAMRFLFTLILLSMLI